MEPPNNGWIDKKISGDDVRMAVVMWYEKHLVYTAPIPHNHLFITQMFLGIGV